MRIEEEIKLDYSDVLLRPKRSTLTSRKDVRLERKFKFYHSPQKGTVALIFRFVDYSRFEVCYGVSQSV